MSLTLAQILAEISANLPDNTTGIITPATLRRVLTDITSSGRIFLNVMDYGATGNGTSDDYPAFASAFTALGTVGGVVYVPPGTYNFASGALTPPNNTIVQGAGMDATIIKNTASFPNAVTVAVYMTMSGTPQQSWASVNTTYPINAPTLGGTTVTTTTAANGSAFPTGSIIFLSGGTHGTSFWYPGWYTTVVSSSGSSGLITLSETLPLGGSQLTTAQQILSLPTNIIVRDMTLISGQTAAIECQGGQNFVLENLKIIPGSFGNTSADVTLGIHKNSTMRNVRTEQQANPLELFVSFDCTIENCHLFNSYILIDGGSFDCSVLNNTIKDPQNNGSNFHGVHVADYTSRNRIISNTITGVPNLFAGINTTAVPDANRDHVIMGNTIVGTSSGGTPSGINTRNGVVVGNLLMNLLNGIQMDNADQTFITGNYFDGCTNNIAPFSGSGDWTNTQSPGLRTMGSGVASPTVIGGGVYQLFQSGGTFSVTGFTGGQPGDEITINMGDGNTTFVNSGGSLQMKSGTNYNPASGVNMSFVCLTTSIWSEKSRSA